MLVALMVSLALTFANYMGAEMDKNVDIEHSRLIQV